MLSRKVRMDLTERLRRSAARDPADVTLLGQLLVDYNGALAEVADGLRSIGLQPTTRIKTTDTIVEKLKRQTSLTLVNMRDLAGARVVRAMTLDEQDEVVRRIRERWPDAAVIDRRADPSFGYRAVHLVPKVGRCSVEVQVRSHHQDMWASIMEACGDVWGRGIRYGGEPSTPDVLCGVAGYRRTRGEWVTRWITLADTLQELADLENEGTRCLARGDAQRAEELGFEIDALVEPLFPEVRSFASALGE